MNSKILFVLNKKRRNHPQNIHSGKSTNGKTIICSLSSISRRVLYFVINKLSLKRLLTSFRKYLHYCVHNVWTYMYVKCIENWVCFFIWEYYHTQTLPLPFMKSNNGVWGVLVSWLNWRLESNIKWTEARTKE